MELDREEQAILAGEFGETRRMMMEILVALGKVFDAERMIPIRSAQVSGASYKTIGEYGLEWLKGLDARAVVPAILNPVGMDRARWREMGIDEGFARKQDEIASAYERLGIHLDCTCTPYYIAITQYGDHVAWSESSAVCYANSVIGARTNREGGPSALAAAIIGKTPYYGLHLVENRRPALVFEVESPKNPDPSWYGALGYLAGKTAGNRIPFFRGIRPGRDSMKALGAAMAASGAVALFHVAGITPDARVFPFNLDGLEVVTVTEKEVRDLYQEIPVDAVAVGCPHFSAEELGEVARLLHGKTVRIPFYVFTSKSVAGSHRDLVGDIEKSGARVYSDTCMVVSPCMERYGAIMVNSGKAFAYVPNMCGGAARIGTLEECVEVATS